MKRLKTLIRERAEITGNLEPLREIYAEENRRNGEFKPTPQYLNYLAEIEDRIQELEECLAKVNAKLTTLTGHC